MGKIIAIMNNKGGVLKTTLAVNIAGVLSKSGKRVLVVDGDPQSNVIVTFGSTADNLKVTLSEVLQKNGNIEEAIEKEIAPNFDILPSSKNLAKFSNMIPPIGETSEKEKSILLVALAKVRKNYDFIIIDSAPHMDSLTENIIKASDFIIVPAALEAYAIRGLVRLINDVNELDGNIKFVVPTLVEERASTHKIWLKFIDKIVKENDIKVTKTRITRSIRAASSITFDRLPVVLTKSRIKQVQQYHDLVKEMGLIK